jgi:hypothetical protein
MNSRLLSMKSWFVTLLVPVALLLLSVRLLLTPFFLEIEYRTPGFPPDTYGFTQADRLQWSKLAVEYLVNRSDVTFLGDLRFTDGNPVYNERELAHMLDVKNLVQIVLKVWYVIIGVLFARNRPAIACGGLFVWVVVSYMIIFTGFVNPLDCV